MLLLCETPRSPSVLLWFQPTLTVAASVPVQPGEKPLTALKAEGNLCRELLTWVKEKLQSQTGKSKAATSQLRKLLPSVNWWGSRWGYYHQRPGAGVTRRKLEPQKGPWFQRLSRWAGRETGRNDLACPFCLFFRFPSVPPMVQVQLAQVLGKCRPQRQPLPQPCQTEQSRWRPADRFCWPTLPLSHHGLLGDVYILD